MIIPQIDVTSKKPQCDLLIHMQRHPSIAVVVGSYAHTTAQYDHNSVQCTPEMCRTSVQVCVCGHIYYGNQNTRTLDVLDLAGYEERT